MKVLRFLKNLFTRTAESPAIQEVTATIENTVARTVEAPAAPKIDSLGSKIKGLKEKAGISHEIEAKPGYRKFRTNDGDIITLESKTGARHTLTSDDIPRTDSTLIITRDVQNWNRLQDSQFLGLRRDNVWGRNGVEKITTVQTTGLTLPAGTSRELRPKYGSLAYRDGWKPTIEYPQVCPKTSTTTITKSSNAKVYNPTSALDRSFVMEMHNPNARYYTGAKYIDRYGEYKAPIWNPYR